MDHVPRVFTLQRISILLKAKLNGEEMVNGGGFIDKTVSSSPKSGGFIHHLPFLPPFTIYHLPFTTYHFYCFI